MLESAASEAIVAPVDSALNTSTPPGTNGAPSF